MEPSPLLRWIGGKTKIINTLLYFVPKEYYCYWEPFLGGASMFFKLKPNTAILSDCNQDLMNFYQVVKDYPMELSNEIEKHRKEHNENYYYNIRKEFNNGGTKIEQAGRFIYINKACFNGIYRVNIDGKFNVPYGKKVHPSLPDALKLNNVSPIFQNVELFCSSFELIFNIKQAKHDDFVYFDPPYPPINEKSNFNHYSQTKFHLQDQVNLSIVANKLYNLKCKVMISNIDTPEIRELYKGWSICSLPVTRWVSANGDRKSVNELVITNYDVEEGIKKCHGKIS